jgi:hypothetical protein
MHSAAPDPRSPAAADRRVESAVLALLILEHPMPLTMAELALVMHADPDRFDPRDAAERAVRELVGAGLLHCRDGFVQPTRAALYFARLELG